MPRPISIHLPRPPPPTFHLHPRRPSSAQRLRYPCALVVATSCTGTSPHATPVSTRCTPCARKVATVSNVCAVCAMNLPRGGKRSCKTCMHRVHTTCAVHVAFRVEVVCKTCTPRPEVASEAATKKFRRYFKARWQIGRPWLQYANGVMPCLACKEYLQPGARQSSLTGTAQLRLRTAIEHGISGVH